jgi:hypothetical protein
MPETTPLIKAALNLRVGAGFDVYEFSVTSCGGKYFCFVLYGIADYGCDYANGFHTALFSFEILLCKYLNKSSRTG